MWSLQRIKNPKELDRNQPVPQNNNNYFFRYKQWLK